jgi:outer membrane biosynthesis protein TonB
MITCIYNTSSHSDTRPHVVRFLFYKNLYISHDTVSILGLEALTSYNTYAPTLATHHNVGRQPRVRHECPEISVSPHRIQPAPNPQPPSPQPHYSSHDMTPSPDSRPVTQPLHPRPRPYDKPLILPLLSQHARSQVAIRTLARAGLECVAPLAAVGEAGAADGAESGDVLAG